MTGACRRPGEAACISSTHPMCRPRLRGACCSRCPLKRRRRSACPTIGAEVKSCKSAPRPRRPRVPLRCAAGSCGRFCACRCCRKTWPPSRAAWRRAVGGTCPAGMRARAPRPSHLRAEETAWMLMARPRRRLGCRCRCTLAALSEAIVYWCWCGPRFARPSWSPRRRARRRATATQSSRPDCGACRPPWACPRASP